MHDARTRAMAGVEQRCCHQLLGLIYDGCLSVAVVCKSVFPSVLRLRLFRYFVMTRTARHYPVLTNWHATAIVNESCQRRPSFVAHSLSEPLLPCSIPYRIFWQKSLAIRALVGIGSGSDPESQRRLIAHRKAADG